MKIAIEQGRIIDPANDFDAISNLYIAHGEIIAIGDQPPKGFTPQQTINAQHKLVVPGLVDLCARVCEPGFEYKADIDSESLAAVSGGITTLCSPPDTDPPIQTPADIEFIVRRQSEVGLTKIRVLAAITQGLRGEQLTDMAHLQESGCVGVTNVYRPFANANVIRRALEYAAGLELTVHIHPQDYALAEGGCAHEGAVSTRLGLPAIPEAAETAAIGFYLPLIEQSGVKAHFCRLSTAKGMNMVRRARHDKLNITADVCVHQLFLTEIDISDFNSLCHTRPPLRSQRDRDALRMALTEDGIQAICSDHNPHDLEAKLAPFPATEPGISSIETLLPLTLRLVEEGVISLPQAVSLLSKNPAEILGLNAGSLAVGKPADICVIDPSLEWDCDPQKMNSRGKNSPFAGWALKGAAEVTLVNGKIVHTRKPVT